MGFLAARASSRRFAGQTVFGYLGQRDRGTIGKLSDNTDIAAHGLDRFSQR